MDDPDKPIPRSAKRHYIVIGAVLFALIVSFIIYRVVNYNVDNTSAATQQQQPLANPESTKATGGQTNDTDTSTDRNVPSQTGSDGNTLLNPDAATQ